MARGETEAREPAAEVRTFLIADVRGYTRFTQERGDVAGARLARRFAEIVREEVQSGGGELLELRGDEALAVFKSPRLALRSRVTECEHDVRPNPHANTLPEPKTPGSARKRIDRM